MNRQQTTPVLRRPKAISMNLHETAYERIEGFLQGTLSNAEAEEVRRQMESDPDFAAQVEWMRDFLGLMKDEKSRTVLQAFREAHRERQRRQWRRMVAAAAILLALVLGLLLIWFLTRPGTPDGGEVPERPSSPSADSASSLSAPSGPIAWDVLVEYESGLSSLGEAENEALQEALQLIANGQRREALPLLEAYLESLPPDEADIDMMLETGKIYLKETEEYDLAADFFNRVLQADPMPEFSSEARYYLALTAIARGDEAAAAATLRQLAEDGTSLWQDKAQQLLQVME